MTQEVIDFIKSDRQWKREHRMSHAKLQLHTSKSDADVKLWKAVFNANALDEEQI